MPSILPCTTSDSKNIASDPRDTTSVAFDKADARNDPPAEYQSGRAGPALPRHSRKTVRQTKGIADEQIESNTLDRGFRELAANKRGLWSQKSIRFAHRLVAPPATTIRP